MTDESLAFAITLNGDEQPVMELPGHWRLIDYLHEIKGLTGAKLGCGAGYCRACTVCHKSKEGTYHAIPSCSTSLRVANGWDITTVEAIGDAEHLHPLQSVLVDEDAFQCGYCTPGFIMEAFALYENLSGQTVLPDDLDMMLRGVLDTHLCRCTGYQRYFEAFKRIITQRVTTSTTPHPKLITTMVPSDDQLSSDSRWELIHLLHEAAEVENALMLQYLYAAFSIKRPMYAALVGFGHRTPGRPLDLLAVAIEEMVHLDTVNRFLVALGSAPNLSRQDFPWEPELYPFPFSMEPLSLRSIAKYLYVEAAGDSIENDPAVKALVEANLPPGQAINRVGSLYQRIGELVTIASEQHATLVDWNYWTEKLKVVQEEGEDDHYEFFRSLLLGTHAAFHGVKDAWSLPIDHPMHPICHSHVNPTAYTGHPTTIVTPIPRKLAMLGNRHYWLTMGLLELSYRCDCALHPAVRRHMAGPLLQISLHLPERYGTPVPFDQLPLEYHAGLHFNDQIDWLFALLRDIEACERECLGYLPAAYQFAATETKMELLHVQRAHAIT